jgi:O-antigen ligase
MFLAVLLVFGIFKDRRILAVGLFVFLVLYFKVPKFQDRLVGGLNIDATAQMRLESWSQGYELISDNFVFGVGYNNLIQAKINKGILTDKEVSSHGDAGIDSSILAIWSTTGIIGLLIFILWYFWNCLSGFKAYFRSKEDHIRNFGLAIGAIFLGLFAHSFFVNSLLYPHIIIIVMIMLAIFYNLYAQKE